MYFRHELEKMAKNYDPQRAQDLKEVLDSVWPMYDGRYLETLAEVIRETSKLTHLSDEDCLVYANETYAEDCYSEYFPELELEHKFFRSAYVMSRMQFYLETRMAQKYGVDNFDELENSDNEDAVREYNSYQRWFDYISEKDDKVIAFLDGEEDDEDGFFD